jgi:hypothetical protein
MMDGAEIFQERRPDSHGLEAFLSGMHCLWEIGKMYNFHAKCVRMSHCWRSHP